MGWDEVGGDVTRWLEALGCLEVSEAGDGSATLVLPGGAGPATVRLDDDAVVLAATLDPDELDGVEGVTDLARSVSLGRSGLLRIDQDEDGGPTVSTRVFLDGLSKHAVAAALGELAKTLEQLRGAAGSARDRRQAFAALDRDREEAQARFQQSQDELARATTDAGAAGRPSAASAAPAPPAPAPADTGWRPTNVVPHGGIAFWTTPDPNQPPAGSLPPGAVVQLVQASGGWALVAAENGWRGWVDLRLLAPMGPAGP